MTFLGIWQALESKKIAADFSEVNKQIDDALSEICFDKYGLSDEVKEQVILE